MEELRELAAFAAALREESIPTTARCAAACCVLDTVSAGAGASDDPLVRRATEELLPLYGTGGDAELWGRARSAPLHAAVFLNALASHTLELDDVHTASKTHIGTVVIPAAWGLARRLGVRGPRLVTAVVAGYETAARVGMALGVVSHRKRGFHATGTAGVFGAAAACGNLLGLDEEHMLSALGMAGTQASGVWAFLADGATCKALHPARAAANGLAAAYLARAGMTGPSGILAAEDGGLFAAMTDAPEPCRLNAGLGETWEILRLDRKPYPCCRSTHCAIDGALALRAEHGLAPEDIRHIEVATYEVGYRQCACSEGSVNPRTPGQARFSTPYAVAQAIVRGEVSLAQFTPEALENPAVRALMQRISVRPDEAFSAAYPSRWGCRIRIETTGGRILASTVSDASGSVANPLTQEQLFAKAEHLLSAAYPGREKQMCEALYGIDRSGRLPAL